MYLAHREQRLDQVRDALRALGDDATARQIVEHVYTDVDEKLWDFAEWSVQAQLDYLRADDFGVLSAGRDSRAESLARSAGQSLRVGDQHALAFQPDPAAVGEIGERLVDRLP